MSEGRTHAYYKHSGAFDFLSPVYMVGLGGAGAVVLGALYGVIIWYMPIIYVNIVLTLGLGLAVGWLAGKGGQFGKVRNREMLIVFGGLVGLLADYAGWVTWVLAITEWKFLVINPVDMLGAMKEIAKEGAWSIGGDLTPTGIVLYAIWAGEAVIITGMSGFIAWRSLRHTPFCEICRRWVKDKKELPARESVVAGRTIRAALEAGDLGPLQALKPVPFKRKAWTEIELLRCPQCDEFHLLTVKSVRVTKDSKGKQSKNEEDIVRNLIVGRPAYEALKRPPAPPPSAPAAEEPLKVPGQPPDEPEEPVEAEPA